jgi:glycosyltransferase involved in cell wall biosynthesis
VKIAIIVPGGVDRSGTERIIPVLLWVIERLAAVAEVHVFALHQEPRPGHWPLLGAQVHNIGRGPIMLRTLAAMLAEHRRAKFDLVHAYWASGPGLIAAAFRVLAGVPMVVTLPGGDFCDFEDIGYGALRTLPGRLRVKAALACADVVIAQSGPIKREAAEFGFASQVLPFGVALDRWPAKEPAQRPPRSTLRLVNVADLNRIKDPETLLRTIANLKARGVDFHLDQLGFDTLHGAVQKRASELGVDDCVTFHGYCPREKVRSMIEQAHLLLVSSRHEGGPVVALEAAVAGVPTVGTRVGQIADWAPEAALATEVGDADGLADAIEYLALNEDSRLRIARAAQARAVRDDADSTVSRLMAIYAHLVTREGKRMASPAPV